MLSSVTTGAVDPLQARPGVSAKRLTAAAITIVSGILFAVSTAVPWWSLSGLFSSFGSGTVQFLPGDSYSASAGSSSASGTYSSLGLGPVGGLYEGILAIAIVLTALSMLFGALGIVGGLGRLRSPRWFGAIRNVGILVTAVAVFAIVIVPALQPTLFHRSAPGTCAGSSGAQSPCSNFWGSASAGGTSISWGADLGWYLTIAGLVLAIAAVVIWASSRSEPWGVPYYSGGSLASRAAIQPPVAVSSVDLDRLIQLKQMVDSGHLTLQEFQQVKYRILGQMEPSSLVSQPVLSPSDELQRVKMLHESGVLTDAEYDELRKRVVARL